MKNIVRFINESKREGVTQMTKKGDMFGTGTMDHRAAKFHKEDLIEMLEKIYEYDDTNDIQVAAYDQLAPQTLTYEYKGIENGNTLSFTSRGIDFVIKDGYEKLLNDIKSIEKDEVNVKFDKCKWVQLVCCMRDDWAAKDAIYMVFEP